MTTTLSLVERVAEFGPRLAIVDPHGPLAYDELDALARGFARVLLDTEPDLAGRRVALLCRPGRDFVTALLAVWWAGGTAVALDPTHPTPELDWLIDDAGASLLVHSADLGGLAGDLRMDRRATVPGIGGRRRSATAERTTSSPRRPIRQR